MLCMNCTPYVAVQPLEAHGGTYHLAHSQPPDDYGTAHVSVANFAIISQLLCRNITSDVAVQPLEAYGGPYHLAHSPPPDDHGTAHFSVADAAGGAFAMTTSVNTFLGSKVISASTGEAVA